MATSYTNLTQLNQFNTFLRSHLKFGSACSRLLLQWFNVLSSAKLQKLKKTCDFVIDTSKSLMKILKRRVAIIDPYGTFVLILQAER